MPSELVNVPVNAIEDAAGIPESGGLPYAPEGDVIHEILERPHMFTRRLAERVDDRVVRAAIRCVSRCVI